MINFAITRIPCTDYCNGITTASLGKPDIDLALSQHSLYVETLQQCGVDVKVLPADEAFPDSCFVEDTAVMIDEAAIITRPGAPTRRDEVKSMQLILNPYRKLEFIEDPGTLEGGDVMQVNKHFYIGVTARTNAAGARQLGAILHRYGYTFSIISMTSALHLKTVVNYIGHNNLLASREMAAHPEFRNFNILTVNQEDLYAANCLYVNDQLIMPKGFERVKEMLLKARYAPLEINMSEFEKMDGGLTCLSLRFQ